MKVAPLIKAIQAHNETRKAEAPGFEYKLVHTGQHYDAKMSDVFFQELGIPAPDFNLGVGSGSHAVQTAHIMTAFEPVLLGAFGQPPSPPDWLVVVGDVNSTMACTLVASKLGVKVAHIEAGLRSGDRTMPEEINRLVTDAIADLLLTPSEDANENLRREGVADSKIKLVGNIMIDSLVANLPKANASGILKALDIKPRGFVYVTLHRPSNVDGKESLTSIMSALSEVARRMPVVFPVHPRTRQRLTDYGLIPPASNAPAVPLQLIEPVGYHDSLALTRHARCVLTDSGGLQEESTYFRTPCLTLRANTERPVTITQGSNRLVKLAQLSQELGAVLGGAEELGEIPQLWDGGTASRVLDAMRVG
jgi:UDP-N-acetylglucosamine 2-epimerase (non-hydrolysing)